MLLALVSELFASLGNDVRLASELMVKEEQKGVGVGPATPSIRTWTARQGTCSLGPGLAPLTTGIFGFDPFYHIYARVTTNARFRIVRMTKRCSGTLLTAFFTGEK